jgi:hypothetical protein
MFGVPLHGTTLYAIFRLTTSQSHSQNAESPRLKGCDMIFDLGVAVSIISAIVAIVSAFIARQAVKTAERTYSIQLVGQLYDMYKSDEMLRDLKIVWRIYHQLWVAHSDTEETADTLTNKGVPIPEDVAFAYFKNLDVDSAEYKAINNAINFWTYLELLLKRKTLSPDDILRFTSPRILGILIPMAKAHDTKYGQDYDDSTILRYADKVLNDARKD